MVANAETLGVGLASCATGTEGITNLGIDVPGVGVTCSALDFVSPGDGRASGLRISACDGVSGI